MRAAAEEAREELIAKAGEFDDRLMETYVHGRAVEPAELKGAIRRGCIR